MTVILVSLLGGQACMSTAAYETTRQVASPRGEALDCAVRTINGLGYTVIDGNRDLGVMKAEKVIVPARPFRDSVVDTITVATYGEGTVSSLRITAGTVVRRVNEPGEPYETSSTSKTAADAVLATCASR